MYSSKSSPEWAPTGPALANIDCRSGLLNQSAHLLLYGQLLVLLEICSFQLLTDPLECINGFFVDLLHLFLGFPCSARGFFDVIFLLIRIHFKRKMLNDTAYDLILRPFVVHWRRIRLFFVVGKTPTDDRVLSKSLQHSKKTFFIITQDFHHHLASYPK